MVNLNERGKGVLCPIFSLPSNFGIGTLGNHAYNFVDWAVKNKFRYWQILPVNPPTRDNSPYTSYSAFAGNFYFIDFDMLQKDGFLNEEDYENLDYGSDSSRVDYSLAKKAFRQVFSTLFENFKNNIPADFDKFCKDESAWLDDYCLFMAIHDHFDGKDLQNWPDDFLKKNKETIGNFCKTNADSILYYKMLQYFFFKQWNSLRDYANEKGLYVIGDIPYYVSANSVDCWSEPENFMLDEHLKPSEVAGCPPDMFCAEGQLWGNPTYNWDYLKENNYDWWVRRAQQCFKIFNVLRIDHFRGLASYYSIDADADNAINGVWKEGPRMNLFNAIHNKLGDVPIIAEDLGKMSDDVFQLLDDSGFPGMKVLQFGFDSRVGKSAKKFLPESVIENSVCYIGTHDNDTLKGWIDSSPDEDIKYAFDYFKVNTKEELFDAMMDALENASANTRIFGIQDILRLGSESRINKPGVVSDKNWSWRFTQDL